MLLNLERRVNKLQARERLILSFVFLTAFVAISYSFFVAPMISKNKEMAQKIPAQIRQIDAIKSELQAFQGIDAGVSYTAQKAKSVADRLSEVNKKIDSIYENSLSGISLEDFLIQLLKKQEGLKLVKIQTMGTELKSDSQLSVSDEVDGISRHGVVFQLSGSYINLSKYVKSLEVAMPKLQWGQMHLKSEGGVTDLSIAVYLFGESR